MIQRLKCSWSNGSTLTHHPKEGNVSNPLWARSRSVFWDQHRVVMMDFLTQGTTIKGTYYVSPLKKLGEAIKTKRCAMLTKGVCLLQDNNTPVHNSRIAQTEAQSCGYEIFSHPPYSPDLALSHFHLFPTMKSFLKGKPFSRMEHWFLKSSHGLWCNPLRSPHLHKARREVTLGGTYIEKD